MTTDDIRELHGVTCRTPDHKHASLMLGENEDGIILFSVVDNPVRLLTPAQARYIADRLYDLCRRIEARKAALREAPKPKPPTLPLRASSAAKQEKPS